MLHVDFEAQNMPRIKWSEKIKKKNNSLLHFFISVLLYITIRIDIIKLNCHKLKFNREWYVAHADEAHFNFLRRISISTAKFFFVYTDRI